MIPPNKRGERRVYDVADPFDARLAVLILVTSGIEAEVQDDDQSRFTVAVLPAQLGTADRILERWAPDAAEVDQRASRPLVDGDEDERPAPDR